MKNFYKYLTFSLLLCLGGGWFFGIVTRSNLNDWYNHLIQPRGTPPNWVFPIVWTILYIIMAFSFAIFLTSSSKNKKVPILFFILQMIFNFSWSIFFFLMKLPGVAFIDIALLWTSILGTIITFYSHSKLSAYLLIPYFIWVSYALYLNLFLWIQNL